MTNYTKYKNDTHCRNLACQYRNTHVQVFRKSITSIRTANGIGVYDYSKRRTNFRFLPIRLTASTAVFIFFLFTSHIRNAIFQLISYASSRTRSISLPATRQIIEIMIPAIRSTGYVNICNAAVSNRND